MFDETEAATYDERRGLSTETMATVVGQLVQELSGRGQVLEIGVGTGRLAFPLARCGIPVIGLDPSAPMLARLVAKQRGSRGPVMVVRGEVAALPFREGIFGAAICCHVLVTSTYLGRP